MNESNIRLYRTSLGELLPHLKEEEMDRILVVLSDELGFECYDDRKFVKDTDFKDLHFLKTLHVRKLIAEWQKSIPPTTPTNRMVNCATTPATPVNTPSTPSSTGSTPSSAGGRKRRAVPCNWAEEFGIPIEHLSPSVLDDLQTSGKAKPGTRRKLVNVLYNEICKVTEKPGKKSLDQVANKCTTRYNSLTDEVEGQLLGTGYAGLSKQLSRKFENECRDHKKAIPDNNNEGETRPKKTKKKDIYGCVEGRYNPKSLPEGDRTLVDVETSEDCPVTPCLVCVKEGDDDDFWAAERFMFVINRKVVHSGITSGVVAMHMLFASYFTFGFEYPAKCPLTLELLQRLLYGINNSHGSKGRKKNDRVLTIVREIANNLVDGGETP